MANPDYLGSNCPDGEILGTSSGKIAFYGGTPASQQTLAANGTDAGTTQALANDLKAKLIALGLCK